MDALVYLKALRRRWWLIVAVTFVALAAALATLPSTATSATPVASRYTATHTLLKAADNDAPIDFARLVLFATTGEIPVLAARELGLPPEEGPLLAASGVQVLPDSEVGALRITHSDADPERAVAVADAFASAVQTFLVADTIEARDRQIEALDASLVDLAERVRDLGEQITVGGLDEPLRTAERAALTQRYQSAFERREVLVESAAPTSPFDTLQEAVAIPVLAQGPGSPVPTSRSGRLGLAALLGLLLGGGLALVLDRLDTRLRTRDQVELAHGLPVLAEVPRLDRLQRSKQEVVSAIEPDSAVAEAYRALRSAVLLVPARPLVPADTVMPPLDLSSWTPPRVILITSASPADGKTSTAVNLAYSLAESGRSVIVLDADFRKPAANTYLGVPHGAGLSDLLTDGLAGGLAAAVRPTALPGVSMVTSGSSTRHPAALLARFGDLVHQARSLADVVIVDSAPLLVANDATDIVPHVDAVLVVAQAGKSTRPRAERSIELLARLGVPVLGVIVQASREVRADAELTYYGPRRLKPEPETAPAVDGATTDDAEVPSQPTLPDDTTARHALKEHS